MAPTEDEEKDIECEDDLDIVVLIASLEHSLPHLPSCRAVAGGLGKVVDMMARHHPTNTILVHPMVEEGPKMDYGSPTAEERPIRIMVDGEKETVRVFRHTRFPNGSDGIQVDFLLLSHPWFNQRTRESIYPNPMTRRKVLGFFSLWNQAVGALIAQHKPDFFHCPDFHTAVATWYAIPKCPRLRVLLVLHNAEYQGSISTDMIRGDKLEEMAKIWNLPTEIVAKHLVHDGRFNMLKAGVDFAIEHQEGKGVCAVSAHYANECMSTYSLLWRLPRIDGLDNPMLEEERANLTQSLQETRRAAKAEMQEFLGLNKDPDARVFVSLGRLVRQKGVDLLADIAPWLLETFPMAQLIIIGPVGDGFGHYAAEKLQALTFRPEYKGRVFIKCEFMRVPEALKFAADFCLMPSRDEPFGYVDIEFAWRGALLVGAQAGGLGKVPGFYYLAQNRENLGRLRRELRAVVTEAMNAPPEKLQRMSEEALRCNFPLGGWQQRILELYREIQPPQPTGAIEMGVAPSRTVPLSRAGSMNSSASVRATTNVVTFTPYATQNPSQNPQEANMNLMKSRPVSMINVNVESVLNVGPDMWISDKEFLVQELAEDMLAERVKSKIEENDQLTIDQVLESIGGDVDLEREESAMGRWLLRPVLGTARVHWIVAIGYVVSPIADFLTTVVATEWGLRGNKKLPFFFAYIPWLDSAVGEGIDTPLLNMILSTIMGLAMAIGLPMWSFAAKHVEPRKLLSASLLFQLPLLVVLMPIQPTVSVAIGLVFMHGLVTSASLLFVCFSFMMSIKADLSQAALRMGVLEMFRFGISWLLTAYIFGASPTTYEGTASNPLPSEVKWVFVPLVLLIGTLTLIPGVLILWAPGPYRNDRFPERDLGLIFKRKSFLLLGISDCIGMLAIYPSSRYITWWLANGWTTEGLLGLTCFISLMLASGTYVWASALSLASVHGLSLLIGTAVLLAPPALLRALVQAEVSTLLDLGRSHMGLSISLISLLFEAIRSSAMWTAKIRILNSRWRLLSYGTVVITCSQVCAMLSPWLSQLMGKFYDLTLVTSNQKELADVVMVSVTPICVVQFLFQVLAALYVNEDMGITTSSRETSAWFKIRERVPAFFAISVVVVVSILFAALHNTLLNKPMAYDPFHQCFVKHTPHCEVLADETGEITVEELYKYDFKLNQYGANTTGRFFCQHYTRLLGGDTFVYWEGRCQVQRCGSEDAVRSGTLNETHNHKVWETWSHHCDMGGQNLVAVHLFEWTWKDIAKECEDYLGPAGFNMVQVSPISEHVAGDLWSTRYQPTSFLLESRSGSREEFVDMVARCRNSGVDVMVDVILNHMAGPYVQSPESERNKECGAEKAEPKSDLSPGKSTQPCLGFTKVEYGNREFSKNRPGKDLFRRYHFHHVIGNERANCGWPPYTNNRHLCDLVGLPDLDTENTEVQKMLQGFLADIHDIGITMLRVDAAMMMFPQSIAEIVQPFPWKYVVQEFYPNYWSDEPSTKRKAMKVGSGTDFSYGWRVGQIVFDSWDVLEERYVNRTDRFGELLELNDHRVDGCPYHHCDSPYPDNRNLLFLDNHDSQREVWKHGAPEAPYPKWNGYFIGDWRPTYKQGQLYNLLQRYELLWPYGDAIRIMSSWAWHEFNTGIPGLRPDSLYDMPSAVHRDDGSVACRDMPTTTPVSDEWDAGTGWICEHRWEGVAAMIRLRGIMGVPRPQPNNKKDDRLGHIAFGLGTVAYVAMSKGYNQLTTYGNLTDWDLNGSKTPIKKAGIYCNLARWRGALPAPGQWHHTCGADTAEVDADGKILRATVPSGGMLVIHLNYTKLHDETVFA